MVRIPGSSWTRQGFVLAVTRVRPDNSLPATLPALLRSSGAAPELDRKASRQEFILHTTDVISHGGLDGLTVDQLPSR